MRYIEFKEIECAVSELCITAAYDLPADVLASMKKYRKEESSERAKMFLDQCLQNAAIAADERLPLCQDTGVAVYFVELGEDVKIRGGTIYDAINSGTARGYHESYLRKSIVDDPLFGRKNTGDNTPAVIHLEIVSGEQLKITLAPKGGGSENMSQIKMLTPQAGRAGVIDFVVKSIIEAGGNPCPPVIVGIGIGGSFEKAAYLAKKALLREVGSINPDPNYAELENEILKRVNATQVGPQGLGGDTTALAVHIEHFPCHIASLPTAVNLNCHAARHATVTL